LPTCTEVSRTPNGDHDVAATDRSGYRTEAPPHSIRLPGIVLGVRLGGFLDGILLHQLLQWHQMLTSTDTDTIGVTYYSPHTVSGLR
jgi:hypothetical protein